MTSYELMKELGVKVCPFCGHEYTEHPAISRSDNKTEICSDCGTFEGIHYYLLENYTGPDPIEEPNFKEYKKDLIKLRNKHKH